MFCVFVGSSVTWLGCNSDEPVPSSKKETAAFLEAQEKEQASKVKKGQRPGPKSIKGKVFNNKDVTE
jgi:hypothetical protein